MIYKVVSSCSTNFLFFLPFFFFFCFDSVNWDNSNCFPISFFQDRFQILIASDNHGQIIIPISSDFFTNLLISTFSRLDRWPNQFSNTKYFSLFIAGNTRIPLFIHSQSSFRRADNRLKSVRKIIVSRVQKMQKKSPPTCSELSNPLSKSNSLKDPSFRARSTSWKFVSQRETLSQNVILGDREKNRRISPSLPLKRLTPPR